jgi:hypothetical protein
MQVNASNSTRTAPPDNPQELLRVRAHRTVSKASFTASNSTLLALAM